ncbi:hypothetical protein BASA60_008648 [Batrachochytrium salamandrivorans]|nr:hypothetical protein BASA60_008648 [Batrachochytrium salamandrivorans]
MTSTEILQDSLPTDAIHSDSSDRGSVGSDNSNHESTDPDPTPAHADHVCFVVHGMGQQSEGSGRFSENLASLRRTCKETALEEFADESLNVEWIGVEWYSMLHGLDTVDRRMKTITLPTCSILRQINNNILADVLFYFTSFHGQTLVNIVAQVLNEAYTNFMIKYPGFNGKVALVCHSLGGIICYDLLAHQFGSAVSHRKQKQRAEGDNTKNKDVSNPIESTTSTSKSKQSSHNSDSSQPSRGIPHNDSHGHLPGEPGVHQETHFKIVYPKLKFTPSFLFTLGSPLPAVLVMRGQLLSNYRLSERIKYFNIFHLYDPLAYRMEPLLDSRYIEISPVLLERPSSNRAFRLSYYQELISAYLPDLSAMSSGVRVPSLADLPSMPTIPSMPYINLAENLPSLTLPSFSGIMLPNMTIPTINFPFPVLPSIPTLSRARDQLSVMYDSMLSNWNGDEDIESSLKKRKRSKGEETESSWFSGSEPNSPPPKRQELGRKRIRGAGMAARCYRPGCRG